MKRIARDQLIYGFDATTPPMHHHRSGRNHRGRIARHLHRPVEQGRGSTIRSSRARDPLKVNPAGGPIYVNGAEPGDALAVTILDIQLGPLGFVRTLNGAGVLQNGDRADAPS